MEEIKLENKVNYRSGDVISLAAVDLSKILVTKKRKIHSLETYDGKLLRIKMQAAFGIVNRGLCRGLCRQVLLLAYRSTKWLALGYFNDIRNKVNRANGKMDTFVGFNKCIYVLVKNAAKTFVVFSGDNN